MAEIQIEKKKPIWPWILAGLLVLLAVLYFLFFTGDDDILDIIDDEVEMVTDNVDDMIDDQAVVFSEASISKIIEYHTFISNDADMGLDHVYSHNALTRLIDATEAVAYNLDVDVKADLDRARSNAGSITDDPLEVSHANKIKNAANIILQALKKIQMQKFPALTDSSTKLQNAVNAIDTDAQTLEQKAAIKNFFEKAGDLLTNMKNK